MPNKSVFHGIYVPRLPLTRVLEGFFLPEFRGRDDSVLLVPGGGGVLAEKLGRGVRPSSHNPYPIYDQNLRFSLPYL